MPDISSIGHGSTSPINRRPTENGTAARGYHSRTPITDRATDSVELSDHAKLLDRLRNLPDVRQDLVNRIRQEITDGTYETPGKLDNAIDGVFKEFTE